jgi:hypothetical protein
VKKICLFVAVMLVVSLAISTAGAKTNLGLFGIGARVGFIMPEDPTPI